MMVPHTGHASAGRVEMSGSLFFRFAFTVLPVFIVFLVFVERDDHAFRPHDQLHVQRDAGHAGLNTYSHSGVCSDSTRPTRSPGFSLDRTWRASSSSSARSSKASSRTALALKRTCRRAASRWTSANTWEAHPGPFGLTKK